MLEAVIWLVDCEDLASHTSSVAVLVKGNSPGRGIDSQSVVHRLGEFMLLSKSIQRKTHLQQKSSATKGFFG